MRILSFMLLLACLLSLSIQPVSAAGWIYTVNSLSDGGDIHRGDGICETGAGTCTLRAAIQESNAYAGPNTILFGLPGSGIRQINLVNAPLPEITETLKVDASSQPNCSVPCVQLSGAALPYIPDGFLLRSDGGLIKGFIITSFHGDGIEIHGDGNVIESNYIGFRPGDASDLGNGEGIWVLGAYNLIGGTTPDKRNVISGNHTYGITLGNASSVSVYDTQIQGNYIGTNAAGSAALPNLKDGIAVMSNSRGTIIGGTTSGAGNVISGNGWNGILLASSISAVGDDPSGSANEVLAYPGVALVQGNFIGTGPGGAGSIGNGSNGIRVWSGSTGNLIGGTSNAARNRIAHNGWNGVALTGTSMNRTTIRRNLIYLNHDLGIDLGENGVTGNDTLDVDSGPNGLQNYPAILSATSSTRAVVARLNSSASSTYTIEFFSSPAGTCDPSNHGEGRTFLGSTSVTTDVSGYVRFTFISGVAFPVGSVITATASDSSERTSEFSTCRIAQ